MQKGAKKCLAVASLLSLIALEPWPALANEEKFLGTVDVPYPIQVKNVTSSGAAAAMGVNYELVNHVVMVTQKPDGAHVDIDYDENHFNQICTTGITAITVTSDRPGLVTVQVMLTFEEKTTHQQQYLTGTFDIDYQKATEAEDSIIFLVNNSTVLHGDQMIPNTAVTTVTPTGKIMVPVRSFASAVGASIDYDETTNTVTLNKNQVTLALPLGTHTLTINGIEQSTKDTIAVNEQGQAFAAIEDLAAAFGYTSKTIVQNDGQITAAILSAKE